MTDEPKLAGDKFTFKIQISKGWSQRLVALSVTGWTELIFWVARKGY